MPEGGILEYWNNGNSFSFGISSFHRSIIPLFAYSGYKVFESN